MWVQGRQIPLAGPKQRAILALLAAHAGEAVSREKIIELLWGSPAPQPADQRLDVHISRLRAALRDGGADPSAIVTVDGGYRLGVAAETLDAVRAQRLIAEGETLLADGAVSEAELRFDAALALWRGPALPELADDPDARSQCVRLDALRVDAVERRADARLAQGRHREATAELEQILHAEPLRERARALLMLALYCAGRESDALAVYDDARQVFSDELGITPGEQLRRLHEQILARDAGLLAAPVQAHGRQVSHRPSRRLIAAALAAAALVSAVAIVIGTDESRKRRGALEVPVMPGTLAFLDLQDGRLLSELPISAETGSSAATLVQMGGVAWLTTASGLLMKIDPVRRRVERTTNLGIEPAAVAAGGGSLWVTDARSATLLRVEPRYGSVVRRIRLAEGRGRSGASGVAFGDGSVWVAHGGGHLSRVDPSTGRVRASLAIAAANAVSFGAGAVWVAASDAGRLVRVDPATDSVTRTVQLQPYLCCVAASDDAVWAMGWRVWKLSPAGDIVSSIPIDGDGANLAVTGGALWIAEGISGKFTRVDAISDPLRSIKTGGLTLYAAVHGDTAMLVTDEGPPDLLRGIKGPIARLVMGSDRLNPTDPAVVSPASGSPWREQLTRATCANLVSHRATDGALIPDAAAHAPLVSPDGRTYTFRIRPGLRFSPPSGQPVSAATFRDTLERALSRKLGPAAVGPALLRDVVGVQRFRRGATRHVAGITARGDRLTITLRRPSGDLEARLASTPFCAVPTGTPVVRNGFDREALPAAGPYYLDSHLGGVQAVLRPNPYYRGSRPPRFAALLYTMAVIPDAAADRVARGVADYAAGSELNPLAGASVARRLGPRRFVRTPTLGADYAVFNADREPFRDRAVRQAASHALDRRDLAAAFDDAVSDQFIPPGMPGFRDERVRSLHGNRVGGRGRPRRFRHRATLLACPQAPCAQAARLVVRDLAQIGIAVSITRRRPADIVLTRSVAAYGDALAFTAAVRRDAGVAPPPSAVTALRGAPRDAAARALELSMLRDGRIAAFGTPTVTELFSTRVGCRATDPTVGGVDLAALCPRDK